MDKKLLCAVGVSYTALMFILYMMHLRIYEDCGELVTGLEDYMVLVITYLIVIFPFSFLISYAGEDSNIGMFVNFDSDHFDHNNEEAHILAFNGKTYDVNNSYNVNNSSGAVAVINNNNSNNNTGSIRGTINFKGLLVMCSWIAVFVLPMSVIIIYDVLVASTHTQLLTHCYQFTTLFFAKYAMFILALIASSGVFRLLRK